LKALGWLEANEAYKALRSPLFMRLKRKSEKPWKKALAFIGDIQLMTW
jgi:hypothetical protein